MTRRALVIGLGRSGSACAKALDAEGFHVTVVDQSDDDAVREMAQTLPRRVDVRLGGYQADVAEGFDLVCPSPGVPWDAVALEVARSAGVPVRSEIDLFLERCPAPVIGITGTNGKTTTTALTAAVVAASGATVHRGGNIGETVLDRVAAIKADDWVVLELSSFQLESLSDPQLAIGCVLNVTPDHLDRHRTMEAYAAIKERAVAHALRCAVLNFDDPITRAMADRTSAPVRFFGDDIAAHDGAIVAGDSVVAVENGRLDAFLPVKDIPLFGAHNVANVLAAVCMGRAAGVELPAIAAAVRAFTPVQHRLEPVRDEDGVLWVNDSKATNVDAALKALAAFGERPLIWLGGGSHKGVPAGALAKAVAARARVAICFGATGPEVAEALAREGAPAQHLVDDLPAAVALAREIAQPGDVVLLAPGYASFDQFRNFEERGATFAALVNGVTQEAR